RGVMFKVFLGDSEDLIKKNHGVASIPELDGDELGYLVTRQRRSAPCGTCAPATSWSSTAGCRSGMRNGGGTDTADRPSTWPGILKWPSQDWPVTSTRRCSKGSSGRTSTF